MYHILYHMDFDGEASAAIYVDYLVSKLGISLQCIKLHPIDYGMPFPDDVDLTSEETNVVILDYSCQPFSVMEALLDGLGDRFTWIDHHKTAIDASKDTKLFGCKGLRRVSDPDTGIPQAACSLTWEYCHGRDVDVPYLITAIDAYDTWYWKHLNEEMQEDILRVQKGLYVLRYDMLILEGQMSWLAYLANKRVGNGSISDKIEAAILEAGKNILAYDKIRAQEEVMRNGFEADFLKYKVLMLNGTWSSTVFDGFYDPNMHDFVVVFRAVKGKQVKLSMYSDRLESTIDLGYLASILGSLGGYSNGGGHVGAAGFVTSTAIFETLFKATGPAKPLS